MCCVGTAKIFTILMLLYNSTDEETSFQEWLEAGGDISEIRIFFKEAELSEQICWLTAKEIFRASPYISVVSFHIMDSEGFE